MCGLRSRCNTPRLCEERQLFRWLAEGLSVAETARRLSVSAVALRVRLWRLRAVVLPLGGEGWAAHG